MQGNTLHRTRLPLDVAEFIELHLQECKCRATCRAGHSTLAKQRHARRSGGMARPPHSRSVTVRHTPSRQPRRFPDHWRTYQMTNDTVTISTIVNRLEATIRMRPWRRALARDAAIVPRSTRPAALSGMPESISTRVLSV